jgi:uncharacterized protein (DUF488 family)
MTTGIFTIGHSTHPLEIFMDLLQMHSVNHLVDIRTVPRSLHNPQYNRDTLPGPLARHGISYRHDASLGGLRKGRHDSINTGWQNSSFRGFADHMQTVEFLRAIDMLLAACHNGRTVLMCAESLPWRCHRSLIADALVVKGAEVLHIMSNGTIRSHELTSFARVANGTVTYPAASLFP